jgi:hypothetical protein
VGSYGITSAIRFPLWPLPVGLVVIFGLLLILTHRYSRKFSSVTTIEVGVAERHRVRFTWNQWSGRVRIFVEDSEIEHHLETVSWSTARTYALFVGTEERHEVSFVKRRPRAFAGLRKQAITAFVDGVSVPQLTDRQFDR